MTYRVRINTKDVAMIFEQLFDELLHRFWSESENLVQTGCKVGRDLLDATANDVDTIDKLEEKVRQK
jgi:hypothetical protein